MATGMTQQQAIYSSVVTSSRYYATNKSHWLDYSL